MKTCKKTVAAVLALCATLALTACGQIRISTDIATVGDSVITKQEVQYYLLSAKAEVEQDAGEAASEDNFWKKGEVDGKPAADVAREKAMETAVRIEVAAIKAREKGFSLSDEETKSIAQTVHPDSSAQKKSVQALCKATGLNDQLLQSMLEKQQLSSMFEQDAMENEPSLTPSEEEISAKLAEDYKLVKHVLIKTQNDATEENSDEASAEDSDDAAASPEPMSDEEKAEKKKLAEDILSRAKAGEDFDALIAEYGEDPGMESSPQGYVVYKGSGMVAPFEEAALALTEVGQISDIVETDYGYHILKLYDLSAAADEVEQYKSTAEQELTTEKLEEYVDKLSEEMNVTINEKRLAGINVAKIEIKATSTSSTGSTGSAGTSGTSGGTSGGGADVTPQDLGDVDMEGVDLGDADAPSDDVETDAPTEDPELQADGASDAEE